jgi:hypothetical protein
MIFIGGSLRMNRPIKAEFGRIAMLRTYCPKCKSMALVIKGKMACCGVDPMPIEGVGNGPCRVASFVPNSAL